VRGSRRSGSAATLEEAIELRETLKGQLTVGTITGKVWTLQIAIAKTYEAVWASARSSDQLGSNAEEAALFLGANTRITDITTDRVDEYIARLKRKGVAGGTINRKLAALSKVLTFALHRSESSGLKSKSHFQRQPSTKDVFASSLLKKKRH